MSVMTSVPESVVKVKALTVVAVPPGVMVNGSGSEEVAVVRVVISETVVIGELSGSTP